MPTTDATIKKKVIVLSLTDISNLRSHHNLMRLYIAGLRKGLASHADVRKHQDNIFSILRAADIPFTLTDNVLLDAEMINDILHRIKGKPINLAEAIQNN